MQTFNPSRSIVMQSCLEGRDSTEPLARQLRLIARDVKRSWEIIRPGNKKLLLLLSNIFKHSTGDVLTSVCALWSGTSAGPPSPCVPDEAAGFFRLSCKTCVHH
eukprot:5184536-Amphidinium_carterae.4